MTVDVAAEAAVIAVPTEFTLEAAMAIRRSLLAALRRGTGAELDLSGVETVDAAALQVLHAAHASFVHRGLPLRLPGVERVVRHAAERAGFLRETGCGCLSPECPWRGGTAR